MKNFSHNESSLYKQLSSKEVIKSNAGFNTRIIVFYNEKQMCYDLFSNLGIRCGAEFPTQHLQSVEWSTTQKCNRKNFDKESQRQDKLTIKEDCL